MNSKARVLENDMRKLTQDKSFMEREMARMRIDIGHLDEAFATRNADQIAIEQRLVSMMQLVVDAR